MNRWNHRLFVATALLFAAPCLQADETKPESDETKTDPFTGMIVAENWEIVRNHCVVCHSAKQFLRQRGDRRTWASILRWMRTDQGMWRLDRATEDRILDYLASYYASGPASRRAPIPADLMPPNPYVSVLKAEFEKKRAKGEIPFKPIPAEGGAERSSPPTSRAARSGR